MMSSHDASSPVGSQRLIPLSPDLSVIRAGTKAATLGKLAGLGLPVPESAVLSSEVCAQWPVGADEVTGAIRSRFGGVLAVRSSAVDEDGVVLSRAGHYTTVLGVGAGDALNDAIGRVVASASTGGRASEIAVLVQEMVDARAAGVAFSADPITGDRDRVIVHAVAGLGDRLVEGRVEPERWSASSCSTTPEGDPTVLEADEVRAIAALARQVATALGTPADIEWAVDGEGHLWLLQGRPITALPVKPELEELGPGTWQQDGAHFSGPMTRFGASTYLPALQRGMVAAFEEWGLLVEAVETRCRGGEVYGRVVPVGGKDGPAPPAWVMGILARTVPALRRRMSNARTAIESGMLETLPTEWDQALRSAFESRVSALLSVDLEALALGELLEHLETARELLEDGQLLHFRLFIPYCVRVAELAIFCGEHLGWSAAESMNLLIGCSSASSAPTDALDAMAALVDLESANREFGLGDDELPPELSEPMDAFVRRFGWRTIGYDPGTRALAEKPDLIYGLLLDRAGDQKRASTTRAARERARETALVELASDASLVARFEALLIRAKRCYPQREDNIALTDSFPCGVLRRALVECGRRLVALGALPDRDLAKHLSLDELRSELRRPSPELAQTCLRREAEARWVLANPGPRTIGPASSPPPDVRHLPEHGRRINRAVMWMMDQELAPPLESASGSLEGRPGSPGVAEGRVVIALSEGDFGKVRSGDVLVAPITAPAWSVLFGRVAAIVTDCGGALSHAAIVAREHAIPAVLATGNATRMLKDGDRVRVDGTTGRVTILG